MGRRTLLLITSILVAAVGTALIGLYVKGADTRATDKHALHSVLVATALIAIGTKPDNSNTAIQEWPENTLPNGYLADLSGISSQTATTTIYPQTPIQAGMFSSTVSAAGGGITDGKLGITVEVEDPARAAGLIKVGSKIEIFAVYAPTGGGPKFSKAVLGQNGGIVVLAIGNDHLGAASGSATNTTTTTDSKTATAPEDIPSTLVGMALSPGDIMKLKDAEANGTLFFGVYGGQQGSS